MRRTLPWSLLTGAVIVLTVTLLVNLRVDRVGLPPPDARMPIRLPDGGTLPLAELVERLRDGPRTPVESLRDGGPGGGGHEPAAADADALARSAADLYPHMAWGPVFKLAEHHRQAGRSDEALALFLSVPPDDPDYGRAQRRIAWSILTWERDEPEVAVPFAHRALAADPFDGNSWQDVVRIYGRTLGLPID